MGPFMPGGLGKGEVRWYLPPQNHLLPYHRLGHLFGRHTGSAQELLRLRARSLMVLGTQEESLAYKLCNLP